MTHHDKDLAAFQAVLLNRLDGISEADDVVQNLRAIESVEEYKQWIESFDPHMAQLAAQLVQKWGVRFRTAQKDTPGGSIAGRSDFRE